MNSEQIAQLFVGIKAKIDTSSFKRAEQYLKGVDKKMKGMQAKFGPDAKSLKGFKASQAQMFKQSIAAQKLQFAGQKQQAVLQGAQHRQAMERMKLEAKARDEGRKAAKHAVQMQAAKLRLQGSELTNQRRAVGLQAAQERLQEQQARRARAASRGNSFSGGRGRGRGRGRGVGGMFGRMMRQGGSQAMGAFSSRHGQSGGARVAGGFGRLAGAGAQAGVGAVGVSAGMALSGLASSATLAAQALAAVAVASLQFLSMAQQSQDRQAMREAQFRAAATGAKADPAQAKAMEQRFQLMADEMGLNTQEVGKDYSRAVSGLAPQMGLDDTQTFLRNLMGFGKSQGASNEEIQRGLTAIGQMAGKGQMYSEELKGQLAEAFGPQTMALMGEAWAKVSGSGLNGQKTIAQLNKDMEGGKITGAKMISALENFGTLAYAKAQEGGALSTAQNTQESQRNRLSNQWERTKAESFRSTGGEGIGGAMSGLSDFLKAAQPQFNALAQTGQKFANHIGEALTYVTEIVNAFNSFGGWDLQDKFDVPALKEFFASVTDGFTQLKEIGSVVVDIFKEIFGEDGGGLITALNFIVDALTGVYSVVEYILRTALVAIKAFKAWKNDDDTFDVKAEMSNAWDSSIGQAQRRVKDREAKRVQDETMARQIEARRLPGETKGQTAERLTQEAAQAKALSDKRALETGSTPVPSQVSLPAAMLRVKDMSNLASPTTPTSTDSTPILSSLLTTMREQLEVQKAAANREVKVEVSAPITINAPTGHSADLATSLQPAIEKMAQDVFKRSVDNAFAGQTSTYQ
ncbi:tape measure protein [Pseudomonas sp.]|uniref:tape measure protein n=1 Tax=Pseudomonas sp. TaxID=306 RepID=UPI002FCA919D